jgi:hypothetical protein
VSSFLLPPEHADLCASLGEPIAEFRVGKFALILMVVLTVVAVVVGLALGIAWLWVLLSARSAEERALVALGGAAAVGFLYVLLHRSKRRQSTQAHLTAHLGHILGFGMLYLYNGAGGWRRARQIRGLRVVVFPRGIARIQADTAHVVRWEEITTVRRAILWEQDQETVFDGGIRLSLETADGREYAFDDALSGLKELRKLVEQHTLPHLLHEALDAYEAGRPVSFGVVSANRRGLAYGGRCLPWAAYGTAETAKGLLHVKALGARRSLWKIRLLEVPNVHVLIALAAYLRKYAP